MMSKGERRKALLRIFIAFGIWQTLDQWARLIHPFLSWELQPPMTMFRVGLVGSLGNGCIFIGTFVTGHLLDSVGTKFAGVIASLASGFYFIVSSQTRQLPSFLGLQLFRVFGNFPLVAESFVGTAIGESEDKERTRAILKLGIPMGLAMVLGPWLGAQSLDWFDGSLRYSQAAAGVLLILLMLPTILFILPEPQTGGRGAVNKYQRLPSVAAYRQLLGNPTLRRCLLLKVFIDIPFQGYDQLIRNHLIAYMITEPSDMAYLLVVVGLSTVLTNLFLIQRLQRWLNPKQILQLSLVLLSGCYLLSSQIDSFNMFMITMPIQVVGVSIAMAELSAQIIGSAERYDVGKAVGLSQGIQLLSAALTPIISGYFIDIYDFSMVCYICSAVSVIGVITTQIFGNFLNTSQDRFLPGIFT